jgi:acyl carrier protein
VAIPDLDVFLLDRRGRPVPQGVAGELFVGGAGVARGYLNRPELTAERFLENPFASGRLYRSGDVARWLPGGELDFRGRADEQVKIRGYRIELGEIEAVLRSVPGVADCAVVAAEAAPGDTRLAAYVVAGAPERAAALVEEALAGVARQLPAYMVPASLLVVERIPLTRNGKLDRRALPAPNWQRGERAEQAAAPQSETELAIAEVWQKVLGVDAVASEDNFFNLGGHSLLAARVVTQVRRRCQVDISVRALFTEPTLGGFAAQVEAALRASAPQAADTPPPATPAAPVAVLASAGTEAPLSFPQQQLLFFDQLSPGSTTYNAALATRFHGELDLDALRAALQTVFERHEALRTVLSWQDDRPHQTVLGEWSLDVPVIDLTGIPAAGREAELLRLARTRALEPFDLSRDLMLRTTVFRLGATEHVILFGAHHIAFDAWAVEVLYRELAEVYDARRSARPPVLPALTAQYRDFAVWQRERLKGAFLEGELDFWRRQLAGAPTALRLPTDRPRPSEQSFRGATHVLELDEELADAVRRVCADRSVTPYMLLLAAFATLLYRRSGQDDLLFGGPMANRQRSDIEPLIGFFANTIVVRAQLAGNPAFAELLVRVRDSVLASYEHQEVPLELVVDAVKPVREPGLSPLFQVNFRVRVGQLPQFTLPGTRSEPVEVDLGLARFDLALELQLLDDGFRAEFNYNRDLFDAATIAALAADFEVLLGQALAAPGTRLLSFAIDDSGAEVAPAPQRVASIRGFRGAR